MKHLSILKKAFILAFLIFLASTIFSLKEAKASCTIVGGPSKQHYNSPPGPPQDYCLNNNAPADGGSGGQAVYNCGTDGQGSYCFVHTYTCTTPCGGSSNCGGTYPSCSGSCSGGATCKAQAPSANNPGGSCGCSGGSNGTSCTTNITSIVEGNSPTQMITNWEYLGGGTNLTQTFVAGIYKSNQDFDCSKPGCVAAVLMTGLDSQRYMPVSGLNYNTTYYVAVKAFNCKADVGQYRTPNCSAPTSLTVVQGSSASQAIMHWTPGYNTSAQRIYVGTNQSDVNNNCAGGTCIAALSSQSPTRNTYTANGLTLGTVYYFRVVNGPNCERSVTKSYTPPYTCTAPVVNSITKVNPASDTSPITINWTPGQNTTLQKVYFGTNQTWVTNNCPVGSTAPGCTSVTVSNTATSYQTSTLPSGSVYYVKIYSGNLCNKSSAIQPFLTSCTLSPTSKSMDVNTTAPFQTVINTDPSGSVTKVTFASDNSTVASVSPAQDTTPADGFKTTVTSHASGQATITTNAYFGATLACTATSPVTVTQNNPWWQVINADVGTNGDLTSNVPGGKFFDMPPTTGGFPGIPVYGGSSNVTGSNVSSPQSWIANTTQNSTKVYDSNFFVNQIPSDVIVNDASLLAEGGGAASPDGYYWYKYDGSGTGLPFTIDSNLDVADKKVILVVNSANLNINANINLTDGVGFFMAIVGKDANGGKGNIIVNPLVAGGAGPNLEGIYLADGLFETGSTNGVNTQLWVRGSVMGYDGISLGRDLATDNSTTPAEVFEYAPDQIFLFPTALGARKISWKEVTP